TPIILALIPYIICAEFIAYNLLMYGMQGSAVPMVLPFIYLFLMMRILVVSILIGIFKRNYRIPLLTFIYIIALLAVAIGTLYLLAYLGF
ncbi:MAG: hypothetical protein WCR55_13325, partial [Lentisphaerota bacterium]